MNSIVKCNVCGVEMETKDAAWDEPGEGWRHRGECPRFRVPCTTCGEKDCICKADAPDDPVSVTTGMYVSIERFNVLSNLETITPERLAKQMHEALKDRWSYIPWSDYPQAPKDFAIQEAALFLRVMRQRSC